MYICKEMIKEKLNISQYAKRQGVQRLTVYRWIENQFEINIDYELVGKTPVIILNDKTRNMRPSK